MIVCGSLLRQQILWNPDFHVAMAQYRYDQEHGNSRNKSRGQNKSREYSVHDNRIPKLHLPPMRSSPLPSARIPRGRRMGRPSARMSQSDSSSYSHDYAKMAAGLGKKTLNKINRQGREIDDMDYAQDRIYYKLGQAGRHADDLNKGMWFSLCWEPLVNVIKSKKLQLLEPGISPFANTLYHHFSKNTESKTKIKRQTSKISISESRK